MWGDNGRRMFPLRRLAHAGRGGGICERKLRYAKHTEIFREKIGMEYDLFCALEAPDTVYAESAAQPDCDDPSKVMLFTDPFCGIFDARVREGAAPGYYRKTSELLKQGEKNGEWGYLFKSLRALCDVLEVKFDLGVKDEEGVQGKRQVGAEKACRSRLCRAFEQAGYFLRRL